MARFEGVAVRGVRRVCYPVLIPAPQFLSPIPASSPFLFFSKFLFKAGRDLCFDDERGRESSSRVRLFDLPRPL